MTTTKNPDLPDDDEIKVNSEPVGTCLQCGQTREQVKANDTICGIEGGYEYVELVAEWPKHHWRDWSDKELDGAKIRPEFWDRYRRASVSYFEWTACEHSTFGHRIMDEDRDEYLIKAGQCIKCGKTPARV